MSDSDVKKLFELLLAKVIPVNYALHMMPDLQQFTLTGTVIIAVQMICYIWNLLMTLLITHSLGKAGCHIHTSCKVTFDHSKSNSQGMRV